MGRKVVGWILISIPLIAIGSIILLSMVSDVGLTSAMITIISAVVLVGCVVVGSRLIS